MTKGTHVAAPQRRARGRRARTRGDRRGRRRRSRWPPRSPPPRRRRARRGVGAPSGPATFLGRSRRRGVVGPRTEPPPRHDVVEDPRVRGDRRHRGLRGPQLRDRRRSRRVLRLDPRALVPRRRVPDGLVPGQGRAPRVVVGDDPRGSAQPPCRLTAGINLVSCADWHRSFSVVLTHAFVQGDYLFKLVASGRDQAYVPLTVWSPSSRATYLIMNRTFTEEGWNAFGGYSYYQGVGPCTLGSPAYPVCNRARVVSFDRPYDTGDGVVGLPRRRVPARPLLRGARARRRLRHRRDGRRAPRASCRTTGSCSRSATTSPGPTPSGWVSSAPSAPASTSSSSAPPRCCATCASSPRRSARTDMRSTTATRARTRSTARGSAMEVTGNTWSSPPTDWSAEPFVGEVYSGYLEPGLSAGVRRRRRALLGLRGHGAARRLRAATRHRERHRPRRRVPGHAVEPDGPRALAHPAVQGVHEPGDLGPVHLLGHDLLHGPAGATPGSSTRATTTGSTRWATRVGAPRPCASAELQRITGNLLWRFGQGPAGLTRPSRSNLGGIAPLGS